MSLYLVYIDHRNYGFTPWSTSDDEQEALNELKQCAKHWKAETIRRFGSCDVEAWDTWIQIDDTGTVCMVEIPDVGEVGFIHVDAHAIDRYRERLMSKKGDQTIKRKIRNMWLSGTPAELAPEHRVAQLCRHGVDSETEYRMYEQYLLVMVDETIKTIHLNESGKWREKPC